MQEICTLAFVDFSLQNWIVRSGWFLQYMKCMYRNW